VTTHYRMYHNLSFPDAAADGAVGHNPRQKQTTRMNRDARRVGFIPAGPETLASSRLQIYLPLEKLQEEKPGSFLLLRRPTRIRKRLGILECLFIFAKVARWNIRTVVFQKVRKGAAPLLMAALRLSGTRVIYIECDFRKRLGFARSVDSFVVPSERLAHDIRLRTGLPTTYIPDPVEFWDREALRTAWQPKERYRVVWIGHRNNWDQIRSLRREFRANRLDAFEIVTVSDHPHADVKWSLDTVRHEILNADLAVIPVGTDLHSTMKSHNRALMFMAAGVPVIVSEGPVYEKLVEDGVTGFVFKSADDLRTLPERLATHGLVDRIRHAAMERASAYSIENVSGLWRELLTAEVPA
jgi:hypothetical protein